jgi:hypothetical protein
MEGIVTGGFFYTVRADIIMEAVQGSRTVEEAPLQNTDRPKAATKRRAREDIAN